MYAIIIIIVYMYLIGNGMLIISALAKPWLGALECT